MSDGQQVGGRYEIGQDALPVDTLKFKDTKKYPDRLKAAMDATGETDALIVQGGSIMKGWMKNENEMIACCSDGTRPVIFKIERIDYEG